MRILLLTHAFNSLSQRLFVALTEAGHELSVELDINDEVSAQAVALFLPDLIIAPFLKRRIPESIWSRHVCLVVHPGIVGDRGPSALDWAILNAEQHWGVTVLQANGVMDGGDVWASVEFPMRLASKSSLYRNEVGAAAVEAVMLALERFASGTVTARPLDYSDPGVRGCLRPAMEQGVRAIHWQADDTRTVLRKIRASDGFPGVRDHVLGHDVFLFNAMQEDRLRGEPGTLLARRHGAVCRATVDGAVWITHMKPALPREADGAFKRPSVQVLGDSARSLPELPVDTALSGDRRTFQEIAYEQHDDVGTLYFDVHNGALSTQQCERLREAFQWARARRPKVLVLAGGRDFWCNGIHLNAIEAADSPADESWRNINAMDDLCRAILLADDLLTVAAMRGNAGAGGVFLALAADRVLAREGIVLNPHYKSMGNLYGSEYWTYLLPARVGEDGARALMSERLPMGARQAGRRGLVDAVIPGSPETFLAQVHAEARAMAVPDAFTDSLAAKRHRRARDEAQKGLEDYRREELEQMQLNFYGFDPSYHVARYGFVHKRPHAWTPLHLAAHRRDPGSALTTTLGGGLARTVVSWHPPRLGRAGQLHRLVEAGRVLGWPQLAHLHLAARDGLVVYELKHLLRDGTTRVLFEPLGLMAHIRVRHPSGGLRPSKSALLPICHRSATHS